ncbi:MAG: cytochrome P450 [Acidobacteriaceae bacterium]|nr:cytochrome P450 [Acidobacteriaceae bacterium]
MLHLRDPAHKRIRSLVSRAFTHESVERWRPRIREIADSLLRNLHGRESLDLIAEFASPFPIIVIAEILGVDSNDLQQFKSWSEAKTELFNPSRTRQQTEALLAADEGLNNYFACAVESRRQKRGDDLVSALVVAEESGQRLTSREIVLTCNLLLLAGTVTTTDLVGNGVLALLKHPEQMHKLRQSPGLLSRAVEKILRYDPPVAQVARVALNFAVLGASKVRPGQASSSSVVGNRDPGIHLDPYASDVERADTIHLAFGGGTHCCIGAPLARAEAQTAVRALVEHFPHLRLDPRRPIEHKPVPILKGLKSLWIRAC